MITKIIFVLGLLAMGGAGYFAFNNHQKFDDVRDAKDANIAKIKGIKGKIANDDELILELHKQITTTEGERDENRERFESNTRQITANKATVNDLDSQVEQTQGQITAIETEVDTVLKDGTPEEFQAKVEDLKKSVNDKEEELNTLEKEIDLANGIIADNRQTISNFESRQRDRAKLIARNALDARVTSVNNDWGFVVINAGENRGVTADSALLVRRGDKIMGKLKISSVEPSITIADIEQSSVPSGGRILPGDKIILAKPAQ